MKLQLKKLGVLNSGEIELGDFTIVCGQNNTGKTYATYAIYGLLSGISSMDLGIIPSEQLKRLFDGRPQQIDLQEVVLDKWPEIVERIGKVYSNMMPEILAGDSSRFSGTSIELSIPQPSLVDKHFEATYPEGAKKPVLAFSKRAGESELQISGFGENRVPYPVYQRAIASAFYDLIFRDSLPPVYCSSAERTGVAIFHNELNFTRTRLFEAIVSLQTTKKLEAKDVLPIIVPQFNPRYPLPVRDNVDYINQLDAEASTESELFAEAPEVLNDFAEIIGGEYKVVKKAIYFKPKSSGATRLTLTESSSAVRSMLDVGFYLRHRAKKGDLLMIDEPELNLHPSNQRRVARLLARLVNFGIRVYITTHSDYIAKELNMLLLLGRLGRNRCPEFGYEESEALLTSQVKLHVACTEKVRRSENAKRKSKQNIIRLMDPLPGGGFEFPSFDDPLDEMNRTQHRIWEALDSEEENQNA